MGQSNRPVTESGIKWNMKILFFYGFLAQSRKCLTSWADRNTAWTSLEEMNKAAFAEGWFCIHLCNSQRSRRYLTTPKTQDKTLFTQSPGYCVIQHARTESTCGKMHWGMRSRPDHADHIWRWSWPIDPIFFFFFFFFFLPLVCSGPHWRTAYYSTWRPPWNGTKKSHNRQSGLHTVWFSCGSL